jgi:predicted Rossmann fold nucleotide-binding protein DprA/Smf involved in DNA uptake
LQKNPSTVDEMAIGLGMAVSQVLNIISLMEINGLIEKNQEKKYQVKL